MDLRIDIELREGLLLVTASGTFAFDAALLLLKQVCDTAKEKEVSKILVNALAVDGELATVERYRLGTEVTAYPKAARVEPEVGICWQTTDGRRIRRARRAKPGDNHRSVFGSDSSIEMARQVAKLRQLAQLFFDKLIRRAVDV